MALQHILDSHMHLFNGGMFGSMAKNSISDYRTIVTNAQAPNYQVDGFIFVETGQNARPGSDVQKWAAGPLDELSFLKGIVEGTSTTPTVATGPKNNGDLMKGIVAWAPINRGVEAFQEYLKAAEKTAGNKTWSRVKGFRYLLQGIRSESSFKKMVEDPAVVKTLSAMGEAGYSFDIGVDAHHGGVWQLERVAGLMETVSDSTTGVKTRFILSKNSHLLSAFSNARLVI
jgi:L-rhamnono-1,4-lactonase